MRKNNHDFWLRIGFAVFLLIWGIDRVARVDQWASASLMGHFYGEIGLIKGFVMALGIAQIVIAVSFVANLWVRYTSLVLLAMLVASTFVTIQPLVDYLANGGNPVPAILFADHFPLIAGTWAIFAHTSKIVSAS